MSKRDTRRRKDKRRRDRRPNSDAAKIREMLRISNTHMACPPGLCPQPRGQPAPDRLHRRWRRPRSHSIG